MNIPQLIVLLLSLWGPEERTGYRYHPQMNFDNLVTADTLLTYDVTNYRLIFDLDIPAETLSAEVEISLTTLEPLDSIRLHFVGMEVSTVEVGGTPRTFARQDSFLVVSLGGTVTAGTDLILKINYHGSSTLASGGFGKGMSFSSGQDEVTYTCNAPWGAKYWFPCQDNPTDKATMEMIVTVPAGYEVISNGRLDSADRTGEDWTFHWMETHPIATYLIVFAASANYALTEDTALVDGSPMPVYHWVLEADSAEITPKLMVAADIVEYFSQLFYPYPFADEKYSHVTVPVSGAMENQTCTHINTNIDWGDWDIIVAHELSHSWWGNATTCGLLKHMWLNEGFATYCEALWAEHRDGARAYQQYYQEEILAVYLSSFSSFQDPIIDPPWSDIYSPLTYEKPASVLHMLRRLVGDEDFFTILTTYGERYKYTTAVSEDFEEVVDEVTGEDFSWFFDQWLRQPGHPVYEFSWNWESSGDSIAVSAQIDQVQIFPPEVSIFTMPMEIGVIDGSDTLYVQFIDSLESQTVQFTRVSVPDKVVLEPHGNLLADYEGVEEEPVPEEVSFQCSSVSTGLVAYHVDASGPVNLSCYDASGRMVKTFPDLPSSGTLDLGRLSSGVYFIRASSDPAVIRRVVIVH